MSQELSKIPGVLSQEQKEKKEQQDWEETKRDLCALQENKFPKKEQESLPRKAFLRDVLARYGDLFLDETLRDVLEKAIRLEPTWLWANYDEKTVLLQDVSVENGDLVVRMYLVDMNTIVKKRIAL